jgi:pimeloyl-ACP methyl ester carboxylesterase
MSIDSESRPRRLPFAFTNLDPSVTREPIFLDASDGAQSMGILYTPSGPRPKTAVYLMHPRGEFTRHYVVPGLTARGYAVFGQNSRYLNNDSDAVHERLLFDIAAGIRRLRSRGFERIILLGNSGGGSLLGFYQAQASRAPEDRISLTPSGERVPLADEEMPEGDLYVAVAAHLGEGRFLLNAIDPSIRDEGDPLSNDPDWDMYNPANGYKGWPEPSSYDPKWLAAYRERQRDRVRRLDVTARTAGQERSHFRDQMRSPEFADGDLDARTAVERRRWLGRTMVIYRTLANPAYLDPTIEPNRRPMGSIFSPADPIIGNYGPGGLARVMTPRGWLSTWSGLSSQADLPDTIGDVTIPTLIVYADGDSDVFPSEQQELLEKSGATDKQLVDLEHSNHYLYAVGEEGEALADPRERLMDIIVPWMDERLS